MDKRIFYVNSGNSLSATSNTFTYNFQVPDNNEYDRITLLQANIPVSYYLIQNGYNTFILEENGVQVTISIPPGNYNIASFSVGVAQLMNISSPNGFAYALNYVSTYNQVITGLYTITCNNVSATVKLHFNPNNTVNEQFGFNTGATAVFDGGKVISTNVVMFNPESVIYLHCSVVDSGYDDILGEIFSGNTPPFGYIAYDAKDPLTTSRKLASNKATSVIFSLTNEHNFPIYLNGIGMSISFMLYKENKITTPSNEGIIRAIEDLRGGLVDITTKISENKKAEEEKPKTDEIPSEEEQKGTKLEQYIKRETPPVTTTVETTGETGGEEPTREEILREVLVKEEPVFYAK